MSSSTKITRIAKALWSYSKIIISILFIANLECYFALLCVRQSIQYCASSLFSIFAFHVSLRAPHSLSTAYFSSSIESGSILRTSLSRSCDAACLYMLLSNRMRLFLWNVCVCVFMSRI